MAVPFFDISRQNAALKNEITSAIQGVVDSGKYILGENVAALEKEVAGYCGTKYAIGVASGTDALHLALKACGIKDGDEIITTPFTFVATAEAIEYCGAKPVFVDIEPNTFNLAPLAIEKAITKQTKAILPVHLYGQACAMDKIMAIANKYSLKVVEDCAQSFGAVFNNVKVGAFGAAGCFSFFPTKNLGCFGDGGMIITSDDKIAAMIRTLRGHGSVKAYHYDIIGYNSRLDELQAAILRVKLPYLDSYLNARRNNASIYKKHLQLLSGVTLPFELPGGLHTFNQYTLKVKDRDLLFEHLKKEKVSAMVYYPLSLHLQAAFSRYKHNIGSFPVCESAQNEVISLPIFPELEASELESICSSVQGFFSS